MALVADLAKAKRLILDQLGYLPLEPDAAHLVSRRLETCAILVTSNRSVAEPGTGFADPVVTTAILCRLLHRRLPQTIRKLARLDWRCARPFLPLWQPT